MRPSAPSHRRLLTSPDATAWTAARTCFMLLEWVGTPVFLARLSVLFTSFLLLQAGLSTFHSAHVATPTLVHVCPFMSTGTGSSR